MSGVQALISDTYEGKSFSRWIAKLCEDYYKDPENQKRYQEYLKEKEGRKIESELKP